MNGPIFSRDAQHVATACDIVLAEIRADANDGWFDDGMVITDLGDLNNWVDASDYIDRALRELEVETGWRMNTLAADIADAVNAALDTNPIVCP